VDIQMMRWDTREGKGAWGEKGWKKSG